MTGLRETESTATDERVARLAAVLAAPVAAWLSGRGVTLVRHWVPTPADAVLNDEAARLLEHHEALLPLLRAIRWSASEARPATLRLPASPSATMQVIAAGENLSRLGLLSSFRVDRRRGVARLRAGNVADGFVTGGWLERGVFEVLRRRLLQQAQTGPIGLVRGAHVRLPDGGYAELDVVAIAGQSRLWVECRTGRVQERLERYATLRRALGLPPHAAVVVGLGLDDDLATTLSALHQLEVITAAELPRRLEAALASHPGALVR